MPNLQIVGDPYADSTGQALSSLAGGFMPDPAAAAQAAKLAEDIRSARVQQEAARQKMQIDLQNQTWAADDRKKMQDAEDAGGNYWRIHTALPQPVNGVAPTPQQMEDGYAEQNYRDQTARLMARQGKSAEDIAKAMGDLQTNYTTAHPAYQANIPTQIQALGPDAIKQYSTTVASKTADSVAKQQEVARNSGNLFGDAIRARKAFDEGSGYVGPVQSWGPSRFVESSVPMLRHGEDVRTDIENKLAAYQTPLKQANLPPGSASDADMRLAGAGMATIHSNSAKAGLDSIDSDLSRILQHMGYNVPPAHVTELMKDIKTQNMQGVLEFAAAHQGGDLIVRQIFEAMR